MRSKSCNKLRISLLNKVIAGMYISFFEGSHQLVHRHVRTPSSSKNETLLRRGVCVCPICKDVKLRFGLSLVMQGSGAGLQSST